MRKKRREESTPFDDVFKTIQVRMPALMVPMVNEIFGTKHDLFSEDLLHLRSEHQTPNGRRYEDSRFCLDGKRYHLECQSTTDGKILLRMLEYDFTDALDEMSARMKQEGARDLYFSRSGILYLRGTQTRQKPEMIRLIGPDQEVLKIKIPSVYVSAYRLEEILEKKLFLFLPFYFMRYEKQIRKQDDKDGLIGMIGQEYQIMQDGIYQFFSKTSLEYCMNMLNDMIREVLYAIIPSEDVEFRNEVNQIMGGKLITTPTTIILDRGIAQGIVQGRKEERVNTRRERRLKKAEKKRADAAEKKAARMKAKAEKAEKEIELLRAELARLKGIQA